jgi:hypothetical protein
MRKLAISCGAVVLLVLAALGVAYGKSASPATHKDGSDVQVIRLQQAPPYGGSDVDAPPKGLTEGDYYTFWGGLKDAEGHPAGRTDGHCMAITVVKDVARYQCLVVETLTNGTIIHDGMFVDDGKPSHFAVLGGTGAYAGVGGEATYLAPNIEFDLTR